MKKASKQKQKIVSNMALQLFVLLVLTPGNNQNQNGGYSQGYNSGPMSSGGNFGGGNRRY